MTLKDESGERTLDNEAVFTIIGRDAPLGFFRRSGLAIHNEWTWWRVLGCAAFVLFCFAFYHWKAGHPQEFTVGGKSLQQLAFEHHWFPLNLPGVLERSGGKLAEWSNHEGNLLHTKRCAAAALGLRLAINRSSCGARSSRRREDLPTPH